MKKIGIFLIIILFVFFLYARYIEINLFTIHSYEIEADVPISFNDLQIIHFSDTLINSEFTVEELDELINEINLLNPDIVFFTGDLIDDEYNITNEEIESIITSLTNLEVSLYKFSIMGDNDLLMQSTYEEIMDLSNFTLLDNETFILYYKDNTPITITGITSITNLDSSYETEKELSEAYNITLIHKPDYFDELTNANLVLSGHYLGSYVNIPIIGTIINRSGAEIYHEDYFTINNTSLYISNGIGVENYFIRFNNIPSINIYNFV